MRLLGGSVITLGNMQAGMLVPLRATQVLATGTTATATGIVGLW